MSRSIRQTIAVIFLGLPLVSCQPGDPAQEQPHMQKDTTMASHILGNPEYPAIAYGGYREKTRDRQPTVEQLKDDMRILQAWGIRLLRTYNTHYPHAENVLRAIRQLKAEDPGFECYVMLGAWIDCQRAWTTNPNHQAENTKANTAEIQRAVDLANQYPDIVKVIAVGNEAMVKWATSYYVQAEVILKWVNHLKQLRESGQLPPGLWITSSDNFASWGGGGPEYHTEDLEQLIRAVDFISMHTYPMHDTHYNPAFWGIADADSTLSTEQQVQNAMNRAAAYAKKQYEQVAHYVDSLGIDKPIHIGETGWASYSEDFFGTKGTRACDEYKQALYYRSMREWTQAEGLTCFFFEAFDEPWKDRSNPGGSENHFGLFTVDGQAKYALWDHVERGAFDGLSRDSQPIRKTYGGSEQAVKADLMLPPVKPF